MIIYKATNKINGKCYIGQTRHSLEERRNAHYAKARQGIKTHFYSAIRKYGEDNFEWEIICTAHNKKILNELETFYITKYDSIKRGYNMVDGGDNNIMDIESVKTKHDEKMRSDEVRTKISASMKKYRQQHPFTEEHRKKLSERAFERERKFKHEQRNSIYYNRSGVYPRPKVSEPNKLMLKRGDTRSVNCYCIDENGTKHSFHSYLDAGLWWYKNYKPFPYSSCTYQRKIKQSIDCGFATYGRPYNKQIFNYPKWYEGGDADVQEVTNS